MKPEAKLVKRLISISKKDDTWIKKVEWRERNRWWTDIRDLGLIKYYRFLRLFK